MAISDNTNPTLGLSQRVLLRARVITELERAGFIYEDGLLRPPVVARTKDAIRQLHRFHRDAVLARNEDFLNRWEDRVIEEFASGTDVVPERIAPIVRPVATEYEAAVFRVASLQWSVPVSQGYGRRSRFLVRDEANGKLIGIFALGDPVFNLGVRDRLIEWTHEQRQARLYNVYDAYVLGAVEPYRQVIGGKLIAFCALANETAAHLVEKYSGTTTVIRGEVKSAAPVLVTTTSSLGRSSIYNRLRYRDRWAFRSIGFTEGFGHFHFSEGLFEELVDFLRSSGREVRGHEYGSGPNWRIRTIRTGLEALGLDGDLLRHGIRREVFLAPRAMAWRAFLRGDSEYLRWFDYPLDDMAAYWRERWALPRAARDGRYLAYDREEARPSRMLEDQPAAARSAVT
jgi:hypothetical protein